MKSLLLLVILLIFYACSSSKQVSDPLVSQKQNEYDESFDPNTLQDDDIIIVKNDLPLPGSTENNSSVAGETNIITEARGFRVQIIATKSIETASQVELEARDVFDSLNHKVYLIFDAPNYKVRVGDVIDRDEADDIRDIAKDYGYRGAFVVRSKVNKTSQ